MVCSVVRRLARMVGDYYFDKSGQDIELLEKISSVAAAAHAPFMTAASHEMLSLESFAELDSRRVISPRSSTTPNTRSGRVSGPAKIRDTLRSPRHAC